MPDGTFLAFDYGSARTGTAVGNTVTGTATPLQTIATNNKEQRLLAIDTIIKDWQPARLLLGLPLSAAEQAPELLGEIKNFGKELKKRYALPVDYVDESNSSVDANRRLKQQRQQGRRKKVNKLEIDQQAAVIILERWLEQQHAK